MTQEELRQAEEEEAEAPHDEWDERSARREAQELDEEAHDEEQASGEEAEGEPKSKKPRLSQGMSHNWINVCY